MPNLSHPVRAALALGLLMFTPIAEAETRQACAERAKVIERLAEKYGETRQSMGLHHNNGVLEVRIAKHEKVQPLKISGNS